MIYVVLTVLGLSLGSFVNALLWRLHAQAALQSKRSKQSDVERKKLSIVHGRSMCTHCRHELAPKDLVPVLSWIQLRGKCRYCHERIDDTPLAELLLPLLLVVSYAVWPYASSGWDGIGIGVFAAWTLVLTCLLALAMYDARWYLLPDRLVVPLTVLATVLVLLLALSQNDLTVIYNAVLGGAVISGTFLLLSLVSKGTWIGGGDVKIGIALGLIVGTPLLALLVIFIASLLGSLYMLPGLVTGKQKLKSMLPFGPFLIASTFVVFLAGEPVFSWYLDLLVL